jgi:hypothetical protein
VCQPEIGANDGKVKVHELFMSKDFLRSSIQASQVVEELVIRQLVGWLAM